jgi:tRNA threonylcarbamoyl adenosine modification protein (Sua5/YciO/YrdC/YwlC family)
MGKEVDLKKGELSRHLNKALKAISDGYVIAIPLEHSYAFACDAFKQDSVRAMNVLHGSPLFTAAQVLVGSSKTAQGVIREITPEISALMKKFWPGLLSLNLRPQLGLSWDLGDANQLDRISIRTPKSKFAKALLAESGPLAVTSGARIGRPAPKELSDIFTLHSDLAFQFNGGKLRQGAATTIVEADAEGVRVLRVGAISLAQIQEIVPSASLI